MAENLLVAQVNALEKNIERMTTLVAEKAIQYRTNISGKFLIAISPHKNDLLDLGRRVRGKTLTQAQYEREWQQLVNLREAIERVCNQCLDYIGGIAVRIWKLEEDICDLAETLVSQSLNQDSKWVSVAIVGEERLLDEVAQTTQIIRLRIPEWGIWSLPFTAYEFGRWIIGESVVRGLSQFFTEEEARLVRLIKTKEIQDLVDPENLTAAEIQGDEILTLAPDIKSFRQSFLKGDDLSEELRQKSRQHESYLKELFADAFGTYFLGPSYPYARLCLRVDPATALRDSVREPSLARRMGLMVQMLNLMSARAKEASGNEDSPYEPETKHLLELWETTIKTLQPNYSTDLAFGRPYDCWAASLFDKLKATYFEFGFSHKQWEAAKILGERFRNDGDVVVDANASLSMVLNAAWYARVRNPDRAVSIERMARHYMNEIVAKSTEGFQQATGTKPGPQTQTVTG